MHPSDYIPVDVEQTMRHLEAYWARGPHEYYPRSWMIRIAGTEHDQVVPDGVQNPYWELLRHYPSINDGLWHGITPFGYAEGLGYPEGLGMSRNRFTTTYAWAIPTPGDVAWIASLLQGRGVVEVGAGTGYWAWQLQQAGVDVVAYEPLAPDVNHYVSVAEPYVPLLQGDATAAAGHGDRALLMSWPDWGGSWPEDALRAYPGDLVIYAGEGDGGACGDAGFFKLLAEEWELIGDSPHHRTWWGVNCRLAAYRRRPARPA